MALYSQLQKARAYLIRGDIEGLWIETLQYIRWKSQTSSAKHLAWVKTFLPGLFQETAFAPPERQWVRTHYVNAVNQILHFTGASLQGKEVLDVGCGDCLIDYGLLNSPLKRLVGLDVVDAAAKDLPNLPARIKRAGLRPPKQIERFEHVCYNGYQFPFPDASFDVVLSWSAFEHIQDVHQVLVEMRRVLRPDGWMFITVYPWFHARHGSHLTDYIKEPFFHLRWTNEEIRRQLEEAAQAKPDSQAFVLDHLWPEFLTLNRFSADDFYEAVKKVGLVARKVELISFCDDLSQAPKAYKLSELMVMGVNLLLTAE